MKTRRITAFLLAEALLLPLCTVGCSETEQPAQQNTDTLSSSISTETEPETEPQPGLLDSLPEAIDLGGTEIRCFGRVTVLGDELTVDELTGEVINDAVYTRDLNVENRLNVKIGDYLLVNGSDYDAFYEMRSTINAGSDDYDLFINNSYTSAQMAAEGCFVDLKSLEYIDLEKPYWSQGYNWASSVGGRQFLATGKGFLGFYRHIFITCFNKTLFQRYGVEEPYQSVLEGKWTIDLQNSIASGFYSDLNGNGKKDAADQYGYVTNGVRETGINDGFWAALDMRAVSKDEGDWYIAAFDLEKVSDGVDKLLALLHGEGSGLFGENLNDGPVTKIFTEGRAAMINNMLNFAESGVAREMEDEYGIVPMAKASEEQSEYYALDQDQFIVYGIPITVPADRTDNIGMFLEAYASESFATVRPAYYETALSKKYANDQESVEMLDIITNSVLIDPAILYLTLSPINIYFLRDIIASGENTTASSYARVGKTFEKFMEKFNKVYYGKED